MTSDTSPLSGQIAVVTGASRGIGAAIAARLASMGATLVLTARHQDALKEIQNEISSTGAHAEAVACDVTRMSDVERLASTVQQQFGRCDILVNNAGIGAFKNPLHQLPPEEWDRVMHTNLRAVYYTIRAFAPMMIAAKGGHIVNISSLAGKNALPNAAVYCASKWGLNGLTYSVAEELRGYNIRVAAVAPGSTDTNMMAKQPGERSRMLQPDDVAHVVAMLVTQAPQAFASEVVIRPTLKP